jgi:hypothetical protein
MAERTFRLYELRGKELEIDLLAQEWAAHMADYSGAYRHADERKIAEERAQQQSLLLFLGGLQQLNYNLQEQDRYNQQQRYDQQQQFFQHQLLYELSKPIRCTTFGATTTCN